MKIPRIMIAAPKSGSGKTLITCALLGALKKQNIDVMAFKCGPDYIDPMFHRTVQNIPAENLDTFFSGEELTRQLFLESAAEHEMAVMEGVMGLFDGLGGVREEGSAYHLAKVTETPIILVMDVHGMGKTMIPLIQGILQYDLEHFVKGIILNRINKNFYETMKPLLEKEISVPVLGCFPNRKEIHLESRHLGLKLPEEIAGLKEQLDMAANQFVEDIDMEQFLKIASEANELEMVKQSEHRISLDVKNKSEITLAVARDEAFCFYYEANIREFVKRGIQIQYFSPLHDSHLPQGISGILLGGGYPELYGEALSSNVTMKEDIRRAIEKGMPSLAECGGFMYLHNSITDMDKKNWPMVGIIDGDISYQGKLVRFGYVKIEEKEAAFLENDKCIKGHEFHYYDSTKNGECCTAVKPVSGHSWSCIYEGAEYFWGFPHLYYPSAPQFVDRFVEQMRKYQGEFA